MPKTLPGEIHQDYVESQVLTPDQIDGRHGLLDYHDDLHQALRGLDDTGGTSSVPTTDELDTPPSPTPFNEANDTPTDTTETFSVSSSSSSSLPSQSLTSPRSSSFSDSSSPFASEDDSPLSKRLCTPTEAKATSLQKDGYCAVIVREVGWKDDDDDYPEGMVLEGYSKDIPICYVTAG